MGRCNATLVVASCGYGGTGPIAYARAPFRGWCVGLGAVRVYADSGQWHDGCPQECGHGMPGGMRHGGMSRYVS